MCYSSNYVSQFAVETSDGLSGHIFTTAVAVVCAVVEFFTTAVAVVGSDEYEN